MQRLHALAPSVPLSRDGRYVVANDARGVVARTHDTSSSTCATAVANRANPHRSEDFRGRRRKKMLALPNATFLSSFP